MKLIIKAAALSGLLALAACGGGGTTQDTANEQASDNMSDALANQAENVSEAADNTSGAAADSLENQSEAADESNEQGVTDEAQ